MINSNHSTIIQLSDTELEKLDVWLKKMSGTTVFQLHGLICAAATSPYPLLPPDWFPIILGEQQPPKFDSLKEAEYCFELIMGLNNQVVDSLINDEIFLPLVNFHEVFPFEANNLSKGQINHLAQWCKGYLVGVEIEKKSWDKLPDAKNLFFCLAVLNLKNPTAKSLGLDRSITQGQVHKIISDMIEALPSLLVAVYDQANDDFAEEPDIQNQKPNRAKSKTHQNILCPCQNGKPFIDCCALDRANLH